MALALSNLFKVFVVSLLIIQLGSCSDNEEIEQRLTSWAAIVDFIVISLLVHLISFKLVPYVLQRYFFKKTPVESKQDDAKQDTTEESEPQNSRDEMEPLPFQMERELEELGSQERTQSPAEPASDQADRVIEVLKAQLLEKSIEAEALKNDREELKWRLAKLDHKVTNDECFDEDFDERIMELDF